MFLYHYPDYLPRKEDGWIFVIETALTHLPLNNDTLWAELNWEKDRSVNSGPSGRSYSIPTKDQFFNKLPLSELEFFFNSFCEYTHKNKTDKFFISGFNSFREELLAPYFSKANKNCCFPIKLATYLEPYTYEY